MHNKVSSLRGVKRYCIAYGPGLLLVALIALHITINWRWLSTNVTCMGWDRMDHLVTTLVYNDILKRVNLRSLFAALIWSNYYPPLVHLSALPFYKIFGISMDTAVEVNFVYLAILLLATYGIGCKLFHKGVGVLAAFIVSTFPMIYAMSRYFYIDFALTAMVALSIYLLLSTDGFRKRGYGLLYGLSLGLGMLVKWTFVAFALPPLLLVLVRSSLVRELWEGVRGWRLEKRWLTLAAAIGLILTLIWYLPNSQEVKRLILGGWLFPISWLLLTLTIYALSRPRSRGNNFWGSILLGFTVAGVWYIPKINFFAGFLLNAYGKPSGRWWGFAPHLSYLINEQLGPFYAFFFLIAACALLIWGQKALRQTRIGEGVALLTIWLLIPYFIFSFQVSTVHSRYIMAILPAVALFIAWGLMEIPSRRARVALILLVAVIALGQFFALSFDGLDGLRQMAVIDLPKVGKVNLLAHGEQIQLPATGPTDPRYWIVPDILDDVMVDKGKGRGKVELGLFVNFHQVHEKHFLYLIYTDYPEIRLRELARNWSGRPAYPQLYEVDYVALRDQFDHRTAIESQETIVTMLDHPPEILRQAFQLIEEYPLPDGSTVFLYKRRFARPKEDQPEEYRELGEFLTAHALPGDALILDPSEQVNLVGPHYRGQAAVYLHPSPPIWDAILTGHGRVFVIFKGELVETRPLEEWFNQHGYRAWDGWYGAAQLIVYGTKQGLEGESYRRPSDAKWGQGIRLLGYTLGDEKARPGEILRLTLYWETSSIIERDYRVFVHLLDRRGGLVAQRDNQPQGGSKPMSGWQVGEEVTDNYGLLLPKDLTPGEYRLVMGIYDPISGTRLSIMSDEDGLKGDTLPLGTVRVVLE